MTPDNEIPLDPSVLLLGEENAFHKPKKAIPRARVTAGNQCTQSIQVYSGSPLEGEGTPGPTGLSDWTEYTASHLSRLSPTEYTDSQTHLRSEAEKRARALLADLRRLDGRYPDWQIPFRLARTLKSLPAESPVEFENVAVEFFRNVGIDATEGWFRFLHSWTLVRCPAGMDAWDLAVEASTARPLAVRPDPGKLLAPLASLVAYLDAIRPGTWEDAVLDAASANQQHLGLKRTNADKRRAVRMVLLVAPQWADNRVSKHVGVSDKTVAEERGRLESTSEIPKLNAREGADGRTRGARAEPKHEHDASAPDPAGDVQSDGWRDFPLVEFLEADDRVWNLINSWSIWTAGDLNNRLTNRDFSGLTATDVAALQSQILKLSDPKLPPHPSAANEPPHPFAEVMELITRLSGALNEGDERRRGIGEAASRLLVLRQIGGPPRGRSHRPAAHRERRT